MKSLVRIKNSSGCVDGSSRTSIRDEKGGDNNDDVSDVDDVDLGDRWRFTYSSADRGHHEVAEEVRMGLRKKT